MERRRGRDKGKERKQRKKIMVPRKGKTRVREQWTTGWLKDAREQRGRADDGGERLGI